MTERNHNPNHDALDREIDAALAKYATIAPRPGLEERILANLRARPTVASTWWGWPAAAALAAILLTVLWISRSEKPVVKLVTQSPSPNTPAIRHPAIQPAKPVSRKRIHSNAAARATVASAPKLDQFPSPQPLSPQETILARYVSNFPEHAALIARARSEELQRDAAEAMDDAGRVAK